jgi:hypothetical protein
MSNGREPEPHIDAVLTAPAAHNEAMSLPIQEVIQQLVDLLGATATANAGGVKETRAVQQWLTGEREPQRPHVLRFALQLALMICSLGSRELARAWFHGANPALGDRVPITLLRDEPLESVQFALMAAARTFASRPGT